MMALSEKRNPAGGTAGLAETVLWGNICEVTEYPPTEQLDWATWLTLVEGGVPNDMLLSLITLRTIRGHRGDDGFLDLDDAGDPFLCFYEETSDDVIFWSPTTGEIATWWGRAFALGEENIACRDSYIGDTSLYVHATPWGWLQDRGEGIVVVDWSQAFDRLRDCPRVAVGEQVLKTYRGAMRPSLPEVFVMRAAA